MQKTRGCMQNYSLGVFGNRTIEVAKLKRFSIDVETYVLHGCKLAKTFSNCFHIIIIVQLSYAFTIGCLNLVFVL